MSDPRELATATIDAALPPMLEVIVRDFHTPDQYSNSDKLKAVELFMKAKGMLQQDKQPQLLSVDINFISADGTPQSPSQQSPSQQTVVIDVQPTEVLDTPLPALPEAAEAPVEPQETPTQAGDPFANLEALLEGI